MSLRRVLIICFVALLGGCDAADTAPSSTTAALTSTTTVPAPAPAELRYAYAPGETRTYDVMVSQDIGFDAVGDAGGFGAASLPIDADLVTESQGTTTYTVADGGTESAFRIDVAARFPETRVAGTVNGETVDNLEEGGVEAELARIDPVDITLLVDARGHIIDDGADTSTVLGADLAALTGLTNDLFSTLVGPRFGHQAVGVGDVWETTSMHEGQAGPVPSRSSSEIVAYEGDVLVIETTTLTDAYTVDFSTEFRDLFLEFAEVEEGAEIPPEVASGLDSIHFSITVDESKVVEVARFDVTSRLIESSTKTSGMRLAMVFRAPDDEGAPSGFEITLDLTQTAVFTLAE